MKVFLKKLPFRILCLILIFPVFPVFSASAASTNDIVKEASQIIFSLEGGYSSIAPNDNGAVSLGLVGWHGTRALNLLKTIVNANPENAKKILGDTLYTEIITVSNWDDRALTDEERPLTVQLLSTKESAAAQDSLAESDIKSYVNHGKSLGITDAKALVYLADLENQMGALGAERVANAAISAAASAAAVTLDDVYEAAMADNVAKKSPARRKDVYERCKKMNFDVAEAEQSYFIGEYKITLSTSSVLNIRSGPSTAYSKISAVPDGTSVKVTEVSGDWGKITYSGVTGWISLSYTTAVKTQASASKGDVNLSGGVDAADARLILRYSAKLESFSQVQIKAGDVTADGNITAADARKVLRASAKLEKL